MTEKKKKLQPRLEKILQVLNSRPLAWVTTLDLYKEGVMSPAAGICLLKKLGAIIETKRENVKYIDGAVYPSVAHYRFMGWAQDE